MERLSMRIMYSILLLLSAALPAKADIERDKRDCARQPSPPAAISACTRLLRVPLFSPANRAVLHNNRGRAYAILRRYRQAIQDFGQAIRLNNNYAAAYYNRGNALKDTRAFGRAIADYDRALRLSPRLAFAYVNRGIAKTMLRRFRAALDDFNKAVRLKPKSALIYNNRGRVNTMLRQYRRAKADFDKAIRLNPRYAHAYFNRGLIYQHVLKDRGAAIADYRKAYQLGLRRNVIAARLRSLGVEP